jgi:hypothetical protein
MNKEQLRDKIRKLALSLNSKPSPSLPSVQEYDELTKFDELKQVIINLLSTEYKPFVASIDWVSPKPSTFRINLKNDQNFYLTYTERSWIAQIEGKKYYLLNLTEEQNASNALARILRYNADISKENDTIENEETDIIDNITSSEPEPEETE